MEPRCGKVGDRIFSAEELQVLLAGRQERTQHFKVAHHS